MESETRREKMYFSQQQTKRMHIIKEESHGCKVSGADDDRPTQCHRIGTYRTVYSKTSVLDAMEKHLKNLGYISI